MDLLVRWLHTSSFNPGGWASFSLKWVGCVIHVPRFHKHHTIQGIPLKKKRKRKSSGALASNFHVERNNLFICGKYNQLSSGFSLSRMKNSHPLNKNTIKMPIHCSNTIASNLISEEWYWFSFWFFYRFHDSFLCRLRLSGTFGELATSTSLSTFSISVMPSSFGYESDADARWKQPRRRYRRPLGWQQQFEFDTVPESIGQSGSVILVADQFFDFVIGLQLARSAANSGLSAGAS